MIGEGEDYGILMQFNLTLAKALWILSKLPIFFFFLARYYITLHPTAKEPSFVDFVRAYRRGRLWLAY